ncbi:helix-turn-helix domain-containing protein [Streptomonospora sp. PA3]|uniref:helix-turn-helix transcriptional regulator n=1 Tax=Streptomonospora sp. PA3 TaxID=2607326 RepID=UPI0012DC2239|nr:helix-turn-helix domain-containing protein [Streptomonospora sp. PA3]MUL43288.1 helix-turn-helix domain-containing protein [Streptomonospora sp. PA3]
MSTGITTQLDPSGAASDKADARRRSARQLWSVRETAEYLCVPERTLYRWRYMETGPPSHRVGRYVRYVPDEVHAWVLQQP